MSAIGDVYRELERIDGKCGALAGLNGAGAAYLGSTMATKTGALVIAPLAAASALLAAATILLLWTLRPRLGATGFNRWAVAPLEELIAVAAADLTAPPPADAAARAATDLQRLSRICLRRNRTLRHAITLSVLAVAAIAAAGAAALI